MLSHLKQNKQTSMERYVDRWGLGINKNLFYLKYMKMKMAKRREIMETE